MGTEGTNVTSRANLSAVGPAVVMIVFVLGAVALACGGITPHGTCSSGLWAVMAVLLAFIGVGLVLTIARHSRPGSRIK